MNRKLINFAIHEAGCLLYAADRNLGGFPFNELTDFFAGREGLKDLVLKGAIMPMSLYQDDGYNVRVVFGNLTEAEQSEWTAKVAWKLNLESGEMVVSGVADEDLEKYIADFPFAETGGGYELGCLVKVPASEYAVSVYSYPPGDLAGGWMRIEDSGLFRACFGKESNLPHEKPIDYFTRTRPRETPPSWIKEGYEEADFLHFLIHLAPIAEELKTPEFEPDGCIAWQYGKPETCPVGIRLE